ncbi:MAG: cytochrome c oxidase subunit 4 [Candidatus Nanopelagicales bacterium]
MRVSGWMFAGLAGFFGLLGAVYWLMAEEPAGTAALVFTSGLGFLIAFYLLFTARRLEPLPEDDDEGDIAEGAGEQGFYSPHSWWPLPLGIGGAMAALGIVFVMWWLILLALATMMFAISGLVFEYYRGEFVRE